MQFKWDRRFEDGKTAPEGKYDVKVIATDKLGNSTSKDARIVILLNLPAGPTATFLPASRPSVTPTISSTATATSISTATSGVVVQSFGSTLEPQTTATPRSAITATPRVTPTPNKIVEWFEVDLAHAR